MSTNNSNVSFEELNDAAKLEHDAKMRKTLLGFAIAAVAIVVIVLGYIFGIRKPAIARADEKIALADAQMAINNTDSALVLYEAAADNSYAAGQRARVMAGELLYNKGEYQKAYDYLNKASLGDDVAAALVICLKGDCLANLDRLDEAISAFDKAISKADRNPQTVPMFMEKKVNILEAQKKYDAAIAVLDEMIQEYPSYADQIQAEGLRTQMEALSGK